MAETGRDKFKKFKGVIKALIAIDSIFPKSINYFFLKVFRNTNGVIGILIRYVLVKNLSKSCGDNVSIQPNVFLFNIHKITFGNNISIHPMCYIDGAGYITIGNNVSIAHNTSILSMNHTWEDDSIPIKYNKEIAQKVILEDDIWIGCGCRILAGVTIKERSVVAAGAVVSKNVESKSIYGGVPARLIKKINE